MLIQKGLVYTVIGSTKIIGIIIAMDKRAAERVISWVLKVSVSLSLSLVGLGFVVASYRELLFGTACGVILATPLLTALIYSLVSAFQRNKAGFFAGLGLFLCLAASIVAHFIQEALA